MKRSGIKETREDKLDNSYLFIFYKSGVMKKMTQDYVRRYQRQCFVRKNESYLS